MRASGPIRARRQIAVVVCLVTCLWSDVAPAQVLARNDPRLPIAATPEQDDATLHDVAFVGTQLGIAVGDRGATWRTSDGGATWEFRPAPTDASLRSVCLLSDQIGWAAGTLVIAGTRLVTGVVLATRDGGRTWTRVDDGTLPALMEVRFFDLEQGCAAGHSTDLCSTGVWTTSDGGRTWNAIPGPRSAGWAAAAFVGPRNGTVVGAHDQQSTLTNGRLLPFVESQSLRGLHDITRSADGRGWLVGDGATLRMTTDHGVSWPEPPAPPPTGLREIQDFHAVASVGEQVWVAGRPGSVVWHSADAGRTWQPQPTGDAGSILGLHFADSAHGWAVGEFGAIRRTANGGQTWQSVRGGSRRPALLQVLGEGTGLSMLLPARESGEHGYRSLAVIATRRDTATDPSVPLDDERRRAAWIAAGGNDVVERWQLPLSAPDLERQRDRLIAEWNSLHEQRLPQVMLGGLVALIRTYRPEVIVYDVAQPEQAVASLLQEALPLAIAQAADPTRYPEHRSLCGLSPWTVPKVFLRTPDVAGATLSVDPHQVLPRVGTTLYLAAGRSALLAFAPQELRIEREHFSFVPRQVNAASAVDQASRSFFGGLNLTAGGDVRRTQPPVVHLADEQLTLLARHQRNFTAYAAQMLDDFGRAGQLIAQLHEAARPLPPAEAAQMLADLADEYRQRGQWEHVEETLIELVETYPDQPSARAAVPWLLARWSSQEVLWQRLRQLSAETGGVEFQSQIALANFDAVNQAVEASENSVELAQRIADLPSPLQPTGRLSSIRVGDLSTFLDQSARNVSSMPVPTGVNQMSLEAARRRLQARRAGEWLRTLDPARFAQPDVQFVLAAQFRAAKSGTAAQEIYRRFYGLDEGVTPWNITARGEIWAVGRGVMSPKPILRCARAAVPPILDGDLGDPCWHVAPGVVLSESPPESDPNDPTFVGENALGQDIATDESVPAATVHLSYDDRYLYFAARVPMHGELPAAETQRAGRVHDDDLHAFDRLSLVVDVDRDYSTWYRFDVDQRGATGDTLWDDPLWNPEWFVAADATAAEWRIEAAIPLNELVPSPPARGSLWAAGITRVLPTQGIEGWTHPVSISPRGDALGLLQFE